ncbi:hypothetical protein EP47_00840 [Legionella norrlandica]|uniref:Uncharacterized protein n=1 Tax=Legionella norrlandica TaxID=1498499 RepID=A0A0A2SNB8_9GAMM|nr:hypothetical protein [Legionella norrlandica]KGP62635.1 hypothetical protein EP47_00840 [Legionella norrlandica]
MEVSAYERINLIGARFNPAKYADKVLHCTYKDSWEASLTEREEGIPAKHIELFKRAIGIIIKGIDNSSLRKDCGADCNILCGNVEVAQAIKNKLEEHNIKGYILDAAYANLLPRVEVLFPYDVKKINEILTEANNLLDRVVQRNGISIY